MGSGEGFALSQSTRGLELHQRGLWRTPGRQQFWKSFGLKNYTGGTKSIILVLLFTDNNENKNVVTNSQTPCNTVQSDFVVIRLDSIIMAD